MTEQKNNFLTMNQDIYSRVDGDTRFAATKVILSTNHQKSDGDLDKGVNINNTIVLTGGGSNNGRNRHKAYPGQT